MVAGKGQNRQVPRTGCFQFFGTLPLNKCRIWKKLVKYLEKNAVTLAIPERHKSLQGAGTWPMPTKPCSALFSTLKGKRRSLYLKTWWQTLQRLHLLWQTLWLLQPWWQALRWTREPTHASINCTDIQEEMAIKISLFSRCGWSRTIRGKGGWGRTRCSHLISIPKWVVKRFQPSSRWPHYLYILFPLLNGAYQNPQVLPSFWSSSQGGGCVCLPESECLYGT